MFTNDSKPFKINCYEKDFHSEESRIDLVKSYTCIHYPFIITVGSYYKSGLVIMKKDRFGRIYIGDEVIEHKHYDYDIETFLDNFVESEALDFVILKCPVLFLIVRTEKGFNIFSTNSDNYLEVFTNPSKIFKIENKRQLYYNVPFDLGYFGKRYYEDSELENIAESIEDKAKSIEGESKSIEGESKSIEGEEKDINDTNRSINGDNNFENAGEKEPDLDNDSEISHENNINKKVIDDINKSIDADKRYNNNEVVSGSTTTNIVNETRNRVKDYMNKELINDMNDLKVNNTSREDDKFVLEMNQPIDEEHFNKLLNSEIKTINLGKIMENNLVEFKKFIIEDFSNDYLYEIVEQFPNSQFDYIEILGKTKIAGYIDNEDNVTWFTESLNQEDDVPSYLKSLNSLFINQAKKEEEEEYDEEDESTEEDENTEE